MGDNLFRNLRKGKQSLGVSLSIPSPEIVEILGQAGFDMVYFSMHASRMSWDDIAHMVRATPRWGITPCARIPIQPWVGDYNPGLAVDAHHAFALGVNVVIASVHDSREARELVESLREESHITGDLRDHNLPTEEALEEWTKQSQEGMMAVPMVESASSWADLEGICSVEGLRAVFLGVGDLTRILGVDRQLEHPKMKDAIKRFIDAARSKNLATMINVGYPQQVESAWDVTLERVRRHVEMGVDVVFGVPVEPFLYETAQRFVREVNLK